MMLRITCVECLIVIAICCLSVASRAVAQELDAGDRELLEDLAGGGAPHADPALAHAPRGRSIEAERSAMARALFERGVERARAGDLERAADLFRRAHALRPGSGIAYNLASALARLGRLVEASEQLQWVIRADETTPEMRASAETTIAQLAPRLSHLRIVLDGSREGVSLTLDGHPLALAVLDESVPIDPGAHRVAALRGHAEVAGVDVSLAEGESDEIALAVPPSVPVQLAPALALHAPEEPAPPPRDDLSWLLWTGIAVAVVAAAAVTTTVLVVDQQGAASMPVSGTTLPAVLEWD